MPKRPPLVAIVDEEEAARTTATAVCRSIGLEVHCFADMAGLEAGLAPESEGCLLLAPRRPGLGGIPAIETAVSRFPRLALIPISGQVDAQTVVAALRAGAVDFLDKPLCSGVLLEAIETAVRGAPAGPLAGGGGAREGEVALLMRSLTRKQGDVVRLFGNGMDEDEIVARLGIHRRSVQRHLKKGLAKLGLTVADRPVLAAVVDDP